MESAMDEASRKRLSKAAAWTMAGGALAVTAASLLGRFDWRLSLPSHFRLHLAAGCLAALPAVLALGGRGPSLALSTALAANLADMLRQEAARPATSPPSRDIRADAGATVVSFNALHFNQEKTAALEWLAGCGADALVVLEISPDWRAALRDRLAAPYPHRALGPDSHGEGILILSRHPLHDRTALNLDDQGLVRVRVDHPTLPFTLIGVHPDHAIERQGLRPQRAFLAHLAGMVRGIEGPVAIAGDFNTTPWSFEFRRFLKASGLDMPLLRRGTFPAGLGWAGLPLDHVLVGHGLHLAAITSGPDLGSDHRPVVARLTGSAIPPTLKVHIRES
jgi:endonuclease/exonuclease/phosphatase (EEP) superfamily protein YafD